MAFGNFKRTYTQTDKNIPASEVFQQSNNRWGWVLGVGTEWAINQNWSIKGEALYHQFKNDDVVFVCTVFCSPAESKRFSNEDSMWVGRVPEDVYCYSGPGVKPGPFRCIAGVPNKNCGENSDQSTIACPNRENPDRSTEILIQC